MDSYYLILEVPEDAGAGEIEAAFRRQMQAVHPDQLPARVRAGPLGREAILLLQELVEAHATLRDPEKRRLYDEGLRSFKGA